jgi:hypothetical protein
LADRTGHPRHRLTRFWRYVDPKTCDVVVVGTAGGWRIVQVTLVVG